MHLNNFNLILNYHVCDVTDPVRIFDILTHFVNEAYIPNTSEARGFIYLPMFHDETAETQFRPNFGVASRQSGVTCWARYIQYLLRT